MWWFITKWEWMVSHSLGLPATLSSTLPSTLSNTLPFISHAHTLFPPLFFPWPSLSHSLVHLPSRFRSKSFASKSPRSMLWCTKKIHPRTEARQGTRDGGESEREQTESNLVYFFLSFIVFVRPSYISHEIKFSFVSVALSMEKIANGNEWGVRVNRPRTMTQFLLLRFSLILTLSPLQKKV